MSKNPAKIKISVPEIIELFKTNPENAYEKLISSGYYINSTKSDNFWNSYMQLDHERLGQGFPYALDTYNKVVWLKLFYDLNLIYKTEKAKAIKELIGLNPDATSLTKSLFLCLELGETSPQPTIFPNYSEHSLEAVKSLLKEVLPFLDKKNGTPYSFELAQVSNNLIKIQIDIALLSEFLDAFIWTDLEMVQNENGKGFKLGLPLGEPKIENLFVLNNLKTLLKRDYKRKDSQPNISEEEHFKRNDPKWKTMEGLATIFVSKGTSVISQPPGTTFLEVDESLLDFDLNDKEKMQEAIYKSHLEAKEQNFHFQFRQALSEIYQPNDEIDIHALHIEIEPNIYVSLYELLCAMSCLIAKADTFRYMAECLGSSSIESIKRSLKDFINSQKPELSMEEKENLMNSEIVHHFEMFDEFYEKRIFNFLTRDSILKWFDKVEELKLKTSKELIAIINLFSSVTSVLPFNPIYKINEKYFFSYTTCRKFNINQFLYDMYISDRLFNGRRKAREETIKIGENHKRRETKFTNSLKEILGEYTPFVKSGLKFGFPNSSKDFGELHGEFDVIAYFESENVIIPIQVKLSNVSPRSERRKGEWINDHIKDKGIRQVVKDVKLLQSKPGLKFIEDKMEIPFELVDPIVYPVIVTDNFFADHIPFVYNENDDYVLCVSYFELKCLLLNEKIHDKQGNWLPFERSNAASRIIESIETNSFWDFLDEISDNYDFSKTLTAINDEMKIEMVI